MAEGDLGTARGSVDINVAGALAALASLRASSASTVGALNTMGRASIRAGTGLAVMGGAIAAGFAVAIRKTAELDKRLSFIKGIAGLTNEQMDALRKTTIKLGQESAYTANEVADGFTELAKAGASVDQIIGGMGQAMITLGQASDIPLDKAATTLVSISETFDLAASKAAHVADIIQGAANASIVSVEDLGVSMKYAGGVAANLGISLEDTATALAILGNAGIRGSTAGTSLRRILLQLTPRTEKAAKEMKKLGIITKDGSNIFYDATGKAKSFAEITEILRKSTAKLTPELRQKAFATIFGDRAINSAIALSKDGAAGFEKMYKAVGNVKAADVAAERLNNLAGAWEIFKGSVDSALISVGTPAQKPLQQLVERLTDLVNAFTNLNPRTQEMIARIVLLTGAVLSGAGAFFLIAGGMLRAIAIMKELSILFTVARAAMMTWLGNAAAAIGGFLISPLGLIIVAIALVIGAFVLLYMHSEKFRKFAQGIATSIKTNVVGAFNDARDAFQHAFEGYNLDEHTVIGQIFQKIGDAARVLYTEVLPKLKQVWDSTVGGLADAGDKVANFIEAFRFNGPYAEGVNLSKIMDVLREVLANLQPIIDNVKSAWDGFTQALKDAWAQIQPVLMPAIQQIIDAFNNDLRPAFEKLGGVINNNILPAIKILGTIFGAAILIIIGVILRLLPLIIKVGAAIITTVIDVIAPVIATLVKIFSAAFTVIGGLIQFFIGLFTGDFSKMGEGIKQIVQGLWNAVVAIFQGAWNTLYALVAGIIRTIVAFFTGLYNTLVGHSIIPDLINGIIQWFAKLPGEVGRLIAQVIGKVVAWAGDLLAKGKKAAGDFVNGVVGKLNDLAGLVQIAIQSAVSAIGNFAGDAWDQAKKLGSNIWEGFKKGMGIASPSFIEKAIFAMVANVDDSVNTLGNQVRDIQRLATTIPDMSSAFVPTKVPDASMATVRQTVIADAASNNQAQQIANQLKAIGVNQQRPVQFTIGTVEDGDSLFRRARATDRMLSMAEGGDSAQIGGLGL